MKIKFARKRELHMYAHLGPDKFINWFYLRINTNSSIKKFGFAVQLDLLKLININIFTVDKDEPYLYI